jgi:hypothetical protein
MERPGSWGKKSWKSWLTKQQARAKASQKTTGKLSEQLQAQKRQTRQDTLKEASQNELRAREADEATQARNYD